MRELTRPRVFTCEDWLPRRVEKVFPFFADPYNLERITPDFLRFQVVATTGDPVCEGTIIDYRLRLRGIPFAWKTRIDEWVPGVRFVDRQIRGPYALWHHTHEFAARDGGTLIRDCVRYRLPLGVLGHVAAGWLVRRDVERIFAHRREATRSILCGATASRAAGEARVEKPQLRPTV